MEPIAIIGIGCRFPGAENPEAFWQLLCDGVDAITEIPKTRWDLRDLYDSDPDTPGKMNSRYGGFLPQVDQFDPHFFGISPQEATAMDPQQRLLLEVAWEALEDAGQVREHLAGSRTGVFVGISNNDYSYTHPENSTRPQGYDLTGNALNIAAGRLSYLFNFKGPAIAIDTACSSSMVAVHLACQSLWNRESTLALAGGVNIILSPIGHIALSKLKALSPDGRCKAFDAKANGYVRSEGAGCIVLKPLSKALADNDPIYATIRGSAVNHDGRSKGLTVPDSSAQEELIRQALDNAGVAPSEISYIEAHGTGTPLGDPMEMIALGSVLATDRQEGNYCAVGAVKTNIGHLEAAAGIASLIKVALSLKHQQLPPSLHFEDPNPDIPFDTLPLRVQQTLSPWPEQFALAKAGVSSFGFAGTNAHVILEQAPESSEVPDQARPLKPPYLLPLSAHSPEAVKSLAQAYQDWLATRDIDPTLLEDICYTASVRRTHHQHRLAVVVNSPEDAKERLQDLLQDSSDVDLAGGSEGDNHRPNVVFVCSGQVPQWWGMGRELLQSEPVFRGAIEECDALIRSQANWSLLAELTADESESRLGETEIAQPAIFALQVALARLWRSWGIEPQAVVGHSNGEVAAAHIAGTLSLTDAVKLICDRGRLMQQATGNGKMAALELSVADTEQLLSEYDPILESANPNLGIAAINSPTSTVVSGESRAMELFLEFLAERQPDVLCQLLPVNYAFNSSQMEPFQQELVQELEGLEPQPETIPIYSTVTGSSSEGSAFDAIYWGQNIREAVRFAPAIEALVKAGHTIFLEISPDPVLSGYIAQTLNHLDQAGVVLPSLGPSQGERATMLTSLGKLYTQGFTVALHKLFRSSHCRVVSLPCYPWQKERYWVEQKSQRPSQTPLPNLLVGQEQQEVTPESLTDSLVEDSLYEIQWQPQERTPEAETQATEATEPGQWVIFADYGGVGQALAENLRTHGHSCCLIYPGEVDQSLPGGLGTINPAVPNHFKRLFQEILGNNPLPCRGVIHLWSLETEQSEALTPSSLEESHVLSCGSVLHLVQGLVQALVNTGSSTLPKLWLVTSGSQAVEAHPAPVALAQASLWGMGRVIGLEHSEIWGGLLDLDPSISDNSDNSDHKGATQQAMALFPEIWQPDGEDHVAFRQGQRYVARLVSSKPTQTESLTLQADGIYLITGGLGSLGLRVARWMVEQGAKNLVLLGRRELPPSDQWASLPQDSESWKRVNAVQELKAMGAKVIVAQADVSNQDEMSEVFEHLRNTQIPLKGVIHAAGIENYQEIQGMDLNVFQATLQPKVMGAWLLHKLTQEMNLDFFVCFSSIASLWGCQGKADYAAANAFLNAIAHHRQALGLPALSINWAPWSGSAMVSEQVKSLLKRIGVDPWQPEEAMSILPYLLGSNSPQLIAANFNSDVFKKNLSKS
ncbi:MAG: SDR family NAD(P)-dependent oxidoreductase [Moorea sp. SIOASIH]|uniref:type I polyketide synthase n=1 Tax=Moorena sp. SIOASIH TaxID=2607817 RepID=UPI0013BA8B4E|nr:type I polyketide synthase [Moorena sp. SIOASIH]NEO36814.1 SDR family NAD(P)-dependent oxidoreductase [Moorena sp. SIOASIH]